MKIRTGFICVVSVLISVLIACGPSPLQNEFKNNNYFPIDQNIINEFLKSGCAYLVIEWAERKPRIMASGCLASKEKGIFYTAKHFTDGFGSLGPDSCKLFFNGKVYDAKLKKVSPIRDAALIRINSPFLPDDFPDPLPIAEKMPAIGDKIYIQGLHPHSYSIRMANKLEGFPDNVINIFETYYGQKMKDLTKESQVVMDYLESTRVNPDPESVRNNPLLSPAMKEEMLKYENDSYIKVLTKRDHKYSFGGLSGGAAVNERGELVGIITAQDPLKFELDEDGLFFDPRSGNINKQLFDNVYITPMGAIDDLQRFVEEAK